MWKEFLWITKPLKIFKNPVDKVFIFAASPVDKNPLRL